MTLGLPDEPPAVVQVASEDGVALVTLARPARLNAITHQLLSELRLALIDLAARRDVRSVVLTGEGRSFCAGLDLTLGLADPGIDDPVEAMAAGMEAGAAVTLTMRSMPQPIVAAIRGHAVGAGFALAAAADVRIVSPDAQFSAPFLPLGMTVGDFGLSWLLPRLIGHSRASHLFLSAGVLDAEAALAYGLAAEVSDDPLQRAMEYAARLADKPPYGIRGSKQLMEAAWESSLQAHLLAEARAQTIGALTEAARRAMAEALGRKRS